MRSNEALLRQLLSEAERSESLMLPHLEPHPAALLVGLVGTALGLATVRIEHMPWTRELGWLALGLVVAGMLMYALMLRPGIGWRIGLAEARLEPVGQAGAPAVLKGAGWKLLCVAGAKRRSLALEFRHEDGGRPLRVFQTRANAGRSEHQLTSQLADVLARRLKVERAGLSL